MNSIRESDGTLSENIPFPVSIESGQWLIMMKYMLECAEQSMGFLDEVKDQLDINDEDIERFTVLCVALEQARHQMALLGGKFFEGLTQNILDNLSVFKEPQGSILKKRHNEFSQTGEVENTHHEEEKVETQKLAESKTETIRKDACLCGAFKKKIIAKGNTEKITVCSPFRKSLWVNEKCKLDGQIPKKQKHIQFQDIPDDDNHPLVIKNAGGVTFTETGFGYEIFYAMHRNRTKIAQIDEDTDESQTFDELLKKSICTALNLKKKGFNEKSVISLCVKNSRYTCIPYIGGLFLGCLMNAIDISFSSTDIAQLLDLVKPDLMFVQKEKLDEIVEALQKNRIKIPIVIMGGEIDGYESLQEYLVAPSEDMKDFRPYKPESMKENCALIFSSGTAALPKAICINHYNILSQAYFLSLSDNLQPVLLSFQSYYWISSVVALGYWCLAGLKRVAALPFEPNRFYKMVDKYRIGYVFLGPYECMLTMKTPKPGDIDLSCLKILCTGGAPINEIVFQNLRQILPDCCIFQYYGATEVAGPAVRWKTNTPEDLALLNEKPLSCGRPFAGFWYKIVDDQTGEILGPFKQGELCVKSDTMVMNGYYKGDASECFDQYGWYKTGDMAYYDDYHCFYVVDRLKEFIIFRNWHIPPIILERILMAHPVVARAVVVGIPHPEHQEHPIGLIILKEGIDEGSVDLEEVAQFVNSQVDETKHLRAGVKIIHSIPMTATGKVKRRALRDSVLRGDVL